MFSRVCAVCGRLTTQKKGTGISMARSNCQRTKSWGAARRLEDFIRHYPSRRPLRPTDPERGQAAGRRGGRTAQEVRMSRTVPAEKELRLLEECHSLNTSGDAISRFLTLRGAQTQAAEACSLRWHVTDLARCLLPTQPTATEIIIESRPTVAGLGEGVHPDADLLLNLGGPNVTASG